MERKIPIVSNTKNQDLTTIITKIPKSDLHVHLDGSVRIETLIELSRKAKLSLPSYTVAGLNKLVFKDHYKNLTEYLQGFGLVLPAMQTPENLERISYEFAQDNINEGVCYVEVRFAPQFHINEKQNIDQVLLSINRGLKKAQLEYNQRPEVKTKKAPEFNYGIIVCAMRSFAKGYAKFLDLFLAAHQHAHPNSIYTMASLELARAAVRIRDQYNIPIVALDLAGEEAGNPPIHHKEAYHFAQQNFMHTTAHAGEACGPDSVWQAITELYPERIGHGFHLFSINQIADKKIKNKKDYINKLVQYLAARRITIEICLTSNTQTIPALKNLKNHSFAKMLQEHLSTTLCTDNRTVSKTCMTKEIILAIKNFNLTKESLKDIVINGFKKSFFPGTYAEKLNYIKRVIATFESLDRERI